MQVLQAIRNINQLLNISQLPAEIRGVAHKHWAVGVRVPLDELDDSSIIHPLRNHRKPAFAYRNPKER